MADPITQEPEKPSEVKFSFLMGLREGEQFAKVHMVAELRLEARSLMPCYIHSLLDVELFGARLAPLHTPAWLPASAPRLQAIGGSIFLVPRMGDIFITQGGAGLARGLEMRLTVQVIEFLILSWLPACLVASVLNLSLGVGVCKMGMIGLTWGILSGRTWVLCSAAGACPACSPSLSGVTPCPLQAPPFRVIVNPS